MSNTNDIQQALVAERIEIASMLAEMLTDRPGLIQEQLGYNKGLRDAIAAIYKRTTKGTKVKFNYKVGAVESKRLGVGYRVYDEAEGPYEGEVAFLRGNNKVTRGLAHIIADKLNGVE